MKKHLLILIFLLSSAEQIYAKRAPNYILLTTEKSFSEQVTRNNTLYEIRDNFNLRSANVKIPDGCVLKFSGGSISNGSVNLNECFIEGDAKFDCAITGCPSNEDIYTKWFSIPDGGLLVLLRNFCSCWYNDKVQITHHNRKRVIHVEKGTYDVTEGIELRYEEDLTIDLGGSTIIDNIDTYDRLRHRASPVIAMRESSRIVIRDCNYQMGKNKGKKNKDGMFIEIGGPHVTTINPNYDIEIDNIKGESFGDIDATFLPISVLGNNYNINIGNITWKGSVSSLINLESALRPLTGKEVQALHGIKEWPYPDYYGLMPYNVTIHNVYGYGRPTSKYGYIRTAGAYNVKIDNVYCWNVREIIELFQGDAGNARAAMNITVNNVCSYWGEDMILPNYAVSVNITRKNPQSKDANRVNSDIAMITFTDCDFQDNGKGNPKDHYLIRVHGNNGMTVFRNCRMSNTQRAVRIADIINTSLLTHTTRFESCLFTDCVVGIDGQNSIISVKDCIFNTGKNQAGQIKYRISGLSKDDLTRKAAMLNAEGNMFYCQSDVVSPYIEISSETTLNQRNGFNISQNVFNNTKSVPAIKAKNVPLNEEQNVGTIVLEK